MDKQDKKLVEELEAAERMCWDAANRLGKFTTKAGQKLREAAEALHSANEAVSSIEEDQKLFELDEDLSAANYAVSSREAHHHFSNALCSTYKYRFAMLMSYLNNEKMAYRNTLLSCMADAEFPLDRSQAKKIAVFLGGENVELARSAVLALNFSDNYEAYEVMKEEMGRVSDDRRLDLLGLIAMTNGH